MRTVFAALLVSILAGGAAAQSNVGASTPSRAAGSTEMNAGASTPARPATTGEVNQGAPTRAGAASGDNTSCCVAGTAPQAMPGVPTVPTGPASGLAAVSSSLFMCLPTYGGKTLDQGGGPGAAQNTCVWKGPVLTRQCPCSTYQYREVHAQSGPGGAARDYEEPYNGSQCVQSSTYMATYCIDTSCTSYPITGCANTYGGAA